MVENDFYSLANDVIRAEFLKAGFEVSGMFLFGSRARGDSFAGSDWDILILTAEDIAHNSKVRIASMIRRKFASFKIDVDIIIKSNAAYVSQKEISGLLAYEIARDGVGL